MRPSTKPSVLPRPHRGALTPTISGSYFEGVCDVCADPERGGTVVVLPIGETLHHLCPNHFTYLRELMNALGAVRNI